MGGDEPPGSHCEKVRTDSDGIMYRSCAGTSYRSVNYHRSPSGTRDTKSIWSISRHSECNIFCESEQKSWSDTDSNRWSVAGEKAQDFGTEGERLAFFPTPTNNTDAWHGFPVLRRGRRPFRCPPDELLTKWLSEGRISYVDQQRILKARF